jgi:hypothetical protein
MDATIKALRNAVLIVGVTVALFVVFRSDQPAKPVATKPARTLDAPEKVWDYSPKKTAPGQKTVRAAYWCGVSFDDAGMVGVAVSRGDTAALAGLLARGNAFQVEAGTRVISGGEIDMGISLVHIDSGFQAGRKCYISTNALR